MTPMMDLNVKRIVIVMFNDPAEKGPCHGFAAMQLFWLMVAHRGRICRAPSRKHSRHVKAPSGLNTSELISRTVLPAKYIP